MSGFPRIPPSSHFEPAAPATPPPPAAPPAPPRPTIPTYGLAGPALLALAIFAPSWAASVFGSGHAVLGAVAASTIAVILGAAFAAVVYFAWGRSRLLAGAAVAVVLLAHGVHWILPGSKPAPRSPGLIVNRPDQPATTLTATTPEPGRVAIEPEPKPERHAGKTPPVVRVYRRSEATVAPSRDH